MLKLNKNASIEKTIGIGLPTLLAINLKLVDGELPEKGIRHDRDTSSLPKIRDGTVEIKKEGGIIILKP